MMFANTVCDKISLNHNKACPVSAGDERLRQCAGEHTPFICIGRPYSDVACEIKGRL